jgi:hypothetical protein
MNIRVTNDNKIVFEGSAGNWLEDNDFDLDVARMIKDCFDLGIAKETWFHSGVWLIEKIA